jgi:DNA polymerase-3 subunit alpha
LYIERRNNPKLRRDIDLPGDIFEKHLRSTFGIPLFQEQVVAICRDIGMTTDETNLMLKIVKDSGSGAVGRNAERLAVLEQSFKEKAAQHGMDEDEAWSFMVGFAGYGFNRAHSTGYGIRSYRTAYLKAHYPVEYMATLLSHSINHQRLDAYEKEARIIGITIKRPDVNLSGVKYRIEGKSIWRPLSVIKGIGEATAVSIEENRPESGYSDVYDLIQANPARHISGGKAYIEQGVMSGKLEVLYKSGALDSIMER